jgi:ATP-dependent DNA ligase
MIRNLDGVYELGRRTKSLLKYKEFEDAEFLVVDVIEGEGTEKGAALFVCRTNTGQTFNVRPRGSLDKRKKQLQLKKMFIGQKLTVRYQPLSKDEVLPRFPVGIKFSAVTENAFQTQAASLGDKRILIIDGTVRNYE